MFPVFQAKPPKLLQAEVGRALQVRLCPEYTAASVNRAVKHFARSAHRLALVRQGAPLHDLDGNVVGQVSPEMEARAQGRIAVESARALHLTVEELTRRFPESFGARPPRPMTADTAKAVLAELYPEFSKNSIKAAGSALRRRRAYLEAQVAGAPRYNLVGQVEGHVTEAEAASARELLEDPVSIAPWLKLLRKGKPLNPVQRSQLLEALERTDSSPIDFAARYGVAVQAVVTQRQLARREREPLLKRNQQSAAPDPPRKPPSSNAQPQKAAGPTVTVRRKRWIEGNEAERLPLQASP